MTKNGGGPPSPDAVMAQKGWHNFEAPLSPPFPTQKHGLRRLRLRGCWMVPEFDRIAEGRREDEVLVVKGPWPRSFRAIGSSLGLIGRWNRDWGVGLRIYVKKRERDSLMESPFAMWR